MMVRKNKYEIIIELNSRGSSKIFQGSIDYLGSKKYQDHIMILKNRIIITAFRSSKIDLDSIFYNHNSSLYNQIIKSLAYYYCISRKYVEIVKITAKRTRSLKQLNKKLLNKKDINQIVLPKFKLNYRFNPIRLQTIFKENEKGKMLLNSITHLIKANNSKDENERFERLWKSFNPLYRLIGKQSNEFDCLVNTRPFIVDNPGYFPNSLPKVSALDKDKLRKPLRWRAMIINNHPTEKDTKAFKSSIERYSDARIMNVYLETINNREQFLKNKGFYNEVINHIGDNIKKNTTIDTELLSILTLRYMYFVRNKSFHGEKIDTTFRLTQNKEIKEFKWLNNILEPLIFDLINSNDKY